ncbi:MAG: D-arabinono-1,4-lactone oxidase [Pseudomonadales bacterium]
MVYWSNWSGRQRIKPGQLCFVRSEADAQALIRNACANNTRIRIAGAGHSHSELVANEGIIMDTSGLAGVIDLNTGDKTAWVWAGTKIYALGRPLHDAGLALANQGDIDRQAIGGACSTGTHGTGQGLKNLSAQVTGARVILASGEIVDCDLQKEPHTFEVARLSLGALGLITRLKLQLRESYKLKELGFNATYADIRERIGELTDENERFEFFWYPQSDEATVKVINETTDAPTYPLSAEGARVAYNYEVLPNHRPHLHTEMEYSIPAEDGPECFAAIRGLLRHQFPDVMWPVEYRTVAADDVWLSMAYERPTVTISVHQDVKQDETEYYRACESIFLDYGGRPHWGKVNYLGADALARAYPRWQDWWKVRDGLDPTGMFLNDYLAALSPARHTR